MLHPGQGSSEPTRRGAACAVVDRQNGIVLRADDGFRFAIGQEWKGFDGHRLPTPLRTLWAERARFVFDGRTVHVTGAIAASVVLLTARPAATQEAAMTARQREIATAFARGWTYKEIAAATRLSPATVRNHLAAVYAALDVHSRRELARALDHEHAIDEGGMPARWRSSEST